MDDIRYEELRFLRAVAAGEIEFANASQFHRSDSFRLKGTLYEEMVAYLLEEFCIAFEERDFQLLVRRLRGEVSCPILCRRRCMIGIGLILAKDLCSVFTPVPCTVSRLLTEVFVVLMNSRTCYVRTVSLRILEYWRAYDTSIVTLNTL